MIVDPATGIPYIITKEQEDTTKVFRFPEVPAGGAPPVTLIHVTDLPTQIRIVTGADLSADGRRLLVRTYPNIYAFTRQPEDAFETIFAAKPCTIEPASEPQGEAIAFAKGDATIYTVSEGPYPAIHRSSCSW